MSLAHASVSVLRTCLVKAVRGADAFALRLLQRTEYALEQTLSSGFSSSRQDVLSAALHNLQLHRSSIINSFPQNLLEALILSARQPFSFSAQTLDAGSGRYLPLTAMAESASRQIKAEHNLVQLVSPQVELALADLDALMSGAQGLEFAQPECNPLRLENYVRALSQSLTALQPAMEVADCWREFMAQQLGGLLASEYARTASLLRQQGVQPARYGVSLDSPPQCLLTLRVLQEMASDLRWIDNQHFTIPQALTDSMLAGWPMSEPAAAPASVHASESAFLPTSVAMQGADQGLKPGWTSYSASALQTTRQPWVSSAMGGLRAVQATQAPIALIHSRTLQRMMSHMTSDGRLLPAVQQVLHQLEPALHQLVRSDSAFFEDRMHPARQLLDELTARSLWFSSESALGFAHFIAVADAATKQLASLVQVNAAMFAQALQYVREQWPPEGRMSGIAALGIQADHEDSTQQGLMHSVLGLVDRQMVSAAIEKTPPNAVQLGKMIRSLPSAKGVPEDILDFVTGPWAEVISQAQQQAQPSQERDPGGYLALVPSLLWSVSPQASLDVSRLVAIAPRLQRRLARGLRSVGRSDVEIAALAARLGSLQQRVLDTAQVLSRSPEAHSDTSTDLFDELPSMFGGLDEDAESAHAAFEASLPVLTEMMDVVFEFAPEPEVKPVTRHVAKSVPEPVYKPELQVQPQPDFSPAPMMLEAVELLESAVAAAPAPVLSASVQSQHHHQVSNQEPVQAPVQASTSEWTLGTWVELRNERQQLRTKLTWVSPQQSLFLFTAEDGSTQSMTRRMRDKLLEQGQLRRLEAIV
ncbi:DUF1631 domain-containing protein [Comamonas sp. Y33R10-2]|uniref:DUF1631 family protein n=1 Tax=Comamonas sp. Y33R10-2 TaxID=2853257 RepID=UPI001C5CBE80|nr:DUF1631 family protein [Comamonas sp. Y33R10-2]QXZ08417.1 DUF1631 domain-containing protein [Comamonas sp. Y33R10-2]